MAKCIYCGAETALHVKGTPVCVSCDAKPKEERKPQQSEGSAAQDRKKATA